MLQRIKARLRRAIVTLTTDAINLALDRQLCSISNELQRIALKTSAKYAYRHMANVPRLQKKTQLIEFALSKATFPGLSLEFGVASGTTLNFISSLTEEKVFGFDSFQGLPEDWTGQFPKGAFKQEELPAVGKNVELVVGLFEDTLPRFLHEHSGPAAFLHVDCDLYSSTRTVFTQLADRIQNGCVIVFDEYFNYPGWEEGEHKAFKEFLRSRGLTYSYIGYTDSQQVAVRIGASSAEFVGGFLSLPNQIWG